MLYQLKTGADKGKYQKVKRVTLAEIGWTELDLQRLLSKNLMDFIDSADLMTIFNERPRQEEPDILALDGNGDLYFFELKRWSGNSENLLQVLRYGQLYGNSGYDELNEMYGKYVKNAQADLLSEHREYFSLENDGELKERDFNRKQHFLVVVNGLDQKTIEAILYWKKKGLSIDAIVYWVFSIGSESYIEFNTYSTTENFLEYETNSYVLNTNSRHGQQYTEDMLREEKAAAYYPGWREKIQKLQEGDTVFLYRSGTGIIAYGEADGKLQKAEYDGQADHEYFMRLNNFCKLKKPISPAEMRELAKTGFPFRTTMYAVSEETATAFKEFSQAT